MHAGCRALSWLAAYRRSDVMQLMTYVTDCEAILKAAQESRLDKGSEAHRGYAARVTGIVTVGKPEAVMTRLRRPSSHANTLAHWFAPTGNSSSKTMSAHLSSEFYTRAAQIRFMKETKARIECTAHAA